MSVFCASLYTCSLSGEAGRWAMHDRIASSASSSCRVLAVDSSGARESVSAVYSVVPSTCVIE